MGLSQAQNQVFRHLLEFGSYFYYEIAYNDSLRQCLTSARGKISEKKLRPKFGSKEPKPGQKLGFSPFCEVWLISFCLKCIQ